MTDQKSILFLLGNDFSNDNRVKIEALALIGLGYRVVIHALINPELPEKENVEGIEVVRCFPDSVHTPYKKEWKGFEDQYIPSLAGQNIDLLHCHDYEMLILGSRIRDYMNRLEKPRVQLIYDSHEYLIGYKFYKRNTGWSNIIKGKVVWNWFVTQEARLLKETDGLISVSQSICDLFEKRLKSRIKPVLIRNMPSEVKLAPPNEKYFQQHFSLPTESKIIIHTGNMHFSKKRYHFLSDAIEQFEDVYMVFIGSMGSNAEMKAYHEQNGLSKKILFHSQVPREEITYYCSMADIGLVYTWNPKWKSYWYAMPNKLMDAALAGLPMLTTSQPELARFIEDNGNGISFNGDDPNALMEAMKKVIADMEHYQEQGALVRQRYSWAQEVEKLKALYAQLLN